MKKSISLLLLLAVSICGFTSFKNNIVSAPTDAALKTAFDYLNAVRANPKAYNTEVKVKMDDCQARPALVWNDKLAAVALAKAKDMANKNYFDHVDKSGNGINILISNAGYTIPAAWIKPKSNNYFESISAGLNTPKAGIINLLNDGGAALTNAGHRKHLLGTTAFYKDLVDIGIGFANNNSSTYKYYLCVIIAKHK